MKSRFYTSLLSYFGRSSERSHSPWVHLSCHSCLQNSVLVRTISVSHGTLGHLDFTSPTHRDVQDSHHLLVSCNIDHGSDEVVGRDGPPLESSVERPKYPEESRGN